MTWWVALAVRRTLAAVITLLAVSVIIFAGTSVLPGDAATAALGDDATPERVAALRAQLDLDRPPVGRYLDWLGDLVTGDLGRSLGSQRPVADLLDQRVGNSLALALGALVLTCVLGTVVGLVAGLRAGGWVDRVVSTSALGTISLPEFVSATALIAVFAFWLDLLPATSIVFPGSSPWQDPAILVLPMIALSITSASTLVRILRASVAETLLSPHVEAARLRGIAPGRLLLVHVLPSSAATTIQTFGAVVAFLLGGAVVVETVFAYPGLGQSLAGAVAGRDVIVVQSIGLLLAAVTLVSYLLADLAALALTPRARGRHR